MICCKKVIFSFLATIIAVPLYAAGVGELMGSLTAVVPDGPYDVGRNPALLSLLPKDRAFGYDLSTIAYSTDTYSADLAFAMTGQTVGKTDLVT